MSDAVKKRIVDEYIRMLEAGVVPWRKPWTPGIPMSYYSHKPYRGINHMSLAMTPHKSVWWITDTAIKRAGGRWKDGVEPMPVLSVTSHVVFTEDKATGEKKKHIKRGSKYFRVFNADDVEGIEFPAENMLEFTPIEALEKIFDEMQNKPLMYERNEGRCYYMPHYDKIVMQNSAQFASMLDWYRVRAHEAIHAAGHPTRCDRPEIAKFVNDPYGSTFEISEYALEELTAEIGASMLLARAGAETQIQPNTVAYVDHYLKLLKRDPQVLFTAANRAQQAVHYILNEKVGYDEEEETSETAHSAVG